MFFKVLGQLPPRASAPNHKTNPETLTALKLVHDYLSDRKQRTSVNNSYSHGLKYFLEYLKVLYLVH